MKITYPTTFYQRAYIALVLVLALASFPRCLHAQLLAWSEATAIARGNTSFGYTSASVIDANGDIVMAGTFQSSITFGTSITLTARSFSDVYVAKMSGTTRQWLWAVRGGGDGSSSGASISTGITVKTDATGNIIIAGTYRYSATLGNLPVLSGGPNGAESALIAKLSGIDGTWLWAASSRSTYTYPITVTGFILDASGNAIITGSFGQTAQFGSLPTITAIPQNSYDGYVASVTASTGQWQWIKHISSLNEASAQGIAVDNAGNVAVAGFYQDSFTLGNLPILPSSGYRNLFIAKFSPTTSQWLWASCASGSNTTRGVSYANSIIFSPAGDVLVAGSVQGGTFQFGSLAPITSDGSYLAKLDGNSGTWQWINSSPNVITYSKLVFDTTGALITAGSFSDTAVFGSSINLTSRGNQDIFLAVVK